MQFSRSGTTPLLIPSQGLKTVTVEASVVVVVVVGGTSVVVVGRGVGSVIGLVFSGKNSQVSRFPGLHLLKKKIL